MPLDVPRVIPGMGLTAPMELDARDSHAEARELFVRGHVESGVPELAAALDRMPTVWAGRPFGLAQLVVAARRAAESPSISAPAADALTRATTDLIRTTMASVRTLKPSARWVADASEEHVEPVLADALYVYVVRDGRDVLIAEALRQLRDGGGGGGPLFSDQRYRARLEHLREELRRDPGMLATRPHRLLWLDPWVRQIARAWAARVQTDLTALERLAKDGARTLVIRFEDIVFGRGDAVASLAALIGLRTEDLRVSGGMLPEREVGAWRRFFTAQTADAFAEEAGAALARLGYIADESGVEGGPAWAVGLPSIAAATDLSTSLDAAVSPARASGGAAKATFDATVLLHADPLRAEASVPEHTVTIDGVTRRLLFICGHPRSGTTWTVAVMNLHPRVFVQGEFRFEALRNGLDQLTRWPWHVAHHEPVRTEAELAGREAIRRIMGAISVHKPDAEWLGDKTPRALRVLIPGAPHVLLVRDGRDVIVSRTFHELSSGGVMLSDPLYGGRMLALQREFLSDPELFRRQPHRLLGEEQWVRTLARQWAQQMRHDLAVAGVMREKSVTPVHELRYERMRADVESERASLYRFLGLDPSEAAPVATANRSAAGFDAETPNGFYRKGVVGDWKNYFTDDARRWFKQAAGDQLIALAYEKDGSW